MREGLWTCPFQFDSHRRFWCEGGAVELWLLYFHVTTKICNHRCSDIIAFYYFYRNIRPNLWPIIRVCDFVLNVIVFISMWVVYLLSLVWSEFLYYNDYTLFYYDFDLFSYWCVLSRCKARWFYVTCTMSEITNQRCTICCFLHVLHVLNSNICIPYYCGHLRRNINW